MKGNRTHGSGEERRERRGEGGQKHYRSNRNDTIEIPPSGGFTGSETTESTTFLITASELARVSSLRYKYVYIKL